MIFLRGMRVNSYSILGRWFVPAVKVPLKGPRCRCIGYLIYG